MPDDELDRVRAAYAARAPVAARYDQRRPDQVAIDAARRAAWGTGLLAHGHELGATLEIGCGSGAVLRWAVEVGARPSVGVDVVRSRLEAALALNPLVDVVSADGRHLPVRSGALDTVVCSTLFSSILDDGVAAGVAGEVERVLRPGGVILWFDFAIGNPRNPDVRGVQRRDVAALFPSRRVELRRVVLAPPIARRLLRAPRVAAVLELLPGARTHLAGVLVAR